MSGDEELRVRLARAIAATPMSSDLSARLCLACRDLAGADGAALTLSTPGHDGLTLFSTQWPQFAGAAREAVGEAIVHAVPLRHGGARSRVRLDAGRGPPWRRECHQAWP